MLIYTSVVPGRMIVSDFPLVLWALLPSRYPDIFIFKLICFLQKKLQTWPHKNMEYCPDDSHAFKWEEQNLNYSLAGNFHWSFGICMDMHIHHVLIISLNHTNCQGHFIWGILSSHFKKQLFTLYILFFFKFFSYFNFSDNFTSFSPATCLCCYILHAKSGFFLSNSW